MKSYLKVKNWEQLQHYSHRNPPWIRLYVRCLDDPEIAAMPDATKAHLVGLWMLAGRYHNELPANLDFLSQKLNATEVVDWEAMLGGGWVIPYGTSASDLLASCKQSARPDTEVQKYRDTEVQIKAKAKASPSKGTALARIPEPAPLSIRETAVQEKTAVRRTKEAVLDLAVDVVFRYWRDRMGFDPDRTHNTLKRKKRILDRLLENGVDVSELLYVVDGCLRSDWYMGRSANSTTKYNGTEHIFLDRERVEKLSNLVPKRETVHPYIQDHETP